MAERHLSRIPQARRARLVAGEWRCLDCGHLSYGDSHSPRCPRCFSQRLLPTLDQSGTAPGRDERGHLTH